MSEVCPAGWHLSSLDEWRTLVTTVKRDAKRLKSTTEWDGIFDGFNALPGGNRYSDSSYSSVGHSGSWWTNTGYSPLGSFINIYPYYYVVAENVNEKNNTENKEYIGRSIRCVKD